MEHWKKKLGAICLMLFLLVPGTATAVVIPKDLPTIEALIALHKCIKKDEDQALGRVATSFGEQSMVTKGANKFNEVRTALNTKMSNAHSYLVLAGAISSTANSLYMLVKEYKDFTSNTFKHVKKKPFVGWYYADANVAIAREVKHCYKLYASVAAFELKVAQKQSEYLDRLRAVQDSISTAQQVAAIGQDAAWWDKLIYNVENLGNTINNYAQRAAVAAETKMSEWINDVIRFVGELIFQMSYYGILVAQRIFMAILMIFCPIMFALSLAPPWNSAWSQWMSKFLSLSLWGFVTYMCIYYIDFILLYNLQQDLIAYNHLLHGSVNSWEQIGALGLQGIGSNCMYAMGMLVGAYIIRFVPEVASWLIPGGVSSGAGSAAGSTVMGMTAMAGGMAGSVVGSAAGGAASLVRPSKSKNSNNKK